MNLIGFSTGALAPGDVESALRHLIGRRFTVVELSALRVPELPLLVRQIKSFDLRQFTYIALHAPSSFAASEEPGIIEALKSFPQDWKIILHPDTVHDATLWRAFGSQLALENMDRRKSDGRSAGELEEWFARLPEARMCLDLAHVQQWDTTMTEAYLLLKTFSDRICQIHVSQLDSASRHYPMSGSAIRAFSDVAWLIPDGTPFIIESRISSRKGHDHHDGIEAEMDREAGKVQAVIDSVPKYAYQHISA